jgi:DNA invertase Pin-like site-specific DNA recombinase
MNAPIPPNLSHRFPPAAVKAAAKGVVYGYARVSTLGQTLETQKLALTTHGIDILYSEKVSGVKERKELDKLLAKLQPGDLIVVAKLDRLARSTLDLLRIIDRITKAGAGFKSLADAWADTTTAQGRLMVTLLAGIAEFERELILQRTSEGRARTKAEGKSIGGRKFKLTAHQQAEALARLDAGESTRDLGKAYNVDHTVIYRLSQRRLAALTQGSSV